MAVKTITIDVEAYEALRRQKRGGQSFSDVIKEHFGGRTTGHALARLVSELMLDESTLIAIEKVVADRSRDPAEIVEL
jgi:predicted CopG family antitoxin